MAKHKLPRENTTCSPLDRIEKRPDNSSEDCARTDNTAISSQAAPIKKRLNVSFFYKLYFRFVDYYSMLVRRLSRNKPAKLVFFLHICKFIFGFLFYNEYFRKKTCVYA